MSCAVRLWDVLYVKGMHFSSKNARLLNFKHKFGFGRYLFQNPGSMVAVLPVKPNSQGHHDSHIALAVLECSHRFGSTIRVTRVHILPF